MPTDKKHAKGRLDKYYWKAKEKGYRARAAFKLIELNKKHHFLQNSKCLIDLCAAPGSWLQVAAEVMPQKSLIVGCDLSPIKPIPKTITFQGDITTDKCRATLRGHLKTWKADCVIHDGAPNVGTAWVQDAFSQNELVLSSLKLATEFLAPNGNFVTKVFRSKDSAKLEWIFKQLFAKVDQTKPPSSRNVSAETFYVCRGYKAPKHLDPKFLDPNYAFMEAAEGKPNMEARVFNPEKKKRKREGYEEGDWTQFKEVPAYEFIQSQDPIDMLGTLNRLHFRTDAGDEIAQTALAKLDVTTEEVRQNCEDLKVLGRKEFKVLLRWRLKARDVFGLRQKKEGSHKKADPKEPAEGEAGEEVAVVESMDDELRYNEEVLALEEQQNKAKRKERRKENERKQRDIVRLQMGMTTPTEIGIEAGENDPVFRLKDVDKASDVRRQIVKGRMHTQVAPEQPKEEDEDEEEVEDEELDELEAQLDGMYEDYQSRREDSKAKARAKRAKTDDDDEFEDFDKRESADSDASSDGDLLEDDDDDEADSEAEDDEGFTTDLRGKDPKEGGLSRRAASFFQQDIFDGIDGLEDDEDEPDNDKERDSGIDVDSPELKATLDDKDKNFAIEDDDDDAASGSEPEEVAGQEEEDDWEEGTTKPGHERESEGRPNIDIITAEAMTLAHQLATGKVTKQQLMDDNFNKYSLRDVDGLPEWFLDDENKHAKQQRPVTKEAAAAIKEKLRALNARPIKKVREAKARKTMRTARRLEKLKKKSEGLAEDGDMGEREKAGAIQKLMAKASKSGKKKQPVKVIKAGGQNKGSGRPRGVKGKYKMVDSRLKKDVRGLKRAAKRQGKK